MTFHREEFVNFLIENGCVEFYDTPFRLKCGRMSWWDANLRKLYRSLEMKKRLARYIYDFAMAHNLKPDFFLGVPVGAIPLGESVNELIEYKKPSQIPATILRSEYKPYGDPQNRYAVGPLEAGKHVVLIDDLVITGSSFMRHIPRLQETGIIIDGVIVCVYRLEKRDNGRTVDTLLEEAYNVKYYYITDATELLIKASARFNPDRRILANIERYYQQYGIQQVKLT